MGGVHQPQPVSVGPPAYAFELAGKAHQQRLAIYAGAGLSREAPTNIPGGLAISRECHQRLEEVLGTDAMDTADPDSLTSVANAAEAIPNGKEVLKDIVPEVADFTQALSNDGHKLLAHLLLEGGVVVITTNWDTCIERAGGAELIPTVVSDQDLHDLLTPALLKVHGCASKPNTLLVSTKDLTKPPSWVRDVVNERLASSYTVFVGIGDIAEYVTHRFKEARNAVGTEGAIFVVSPRISTEWDNTLSDLPRQRRILKKSSQFLDDLGRAYIRHILNQIGNELSPDSPTSDAFAVARDAFESNTALEVLQWSRACAVKRSAGKSALSQQAFPKP